MLTACFQCGHKFLHPGDAYLAHFEVHRLDFRDSLVTVNFSLRCGKCVVTNRWRGYMTTDECRYLSEDLESFENPLCDEIKHPAELF